MKKKKNTAVDRCRLSVYRSHRHIYAQIIDDRQGKTLVAVCDKNLPKNDKSKKKADFSGKKGVAFQVGLQLAAKAKKKKVNKIYFDRGRYPYHGRVKAMVEGVRKGGLTV